jgi:hypothetical protein
MGRLIDADAFYKRYCEMYEDGVDEGEIDRVAYMLSTEPTAYDVDAVIEQLKEESYFVIPRGKNTTYFADTVIDIGDAINIVKAGGVE